MSDRPPENPQSPTGDPERTLNDILAALSRVGESDEPSVPESAGMHGAVAELSAALDQLFTLVRTDRAEQRARITELEAALSVAHARIRQLEAGEQLSDIPAPPPNDFGQLREAAERLRQRTEELFRDAGPVTQSAAAGVGGLTAESALNVSGAGDDEGTPDAPADEWPATDEDAEARIKAARDAVELSMAEDHPSTADSAEAEEFAVLRVFPGAAGPQDDSIDVESDLQLEEPEEAKQAMQAVAALPIPVAETVAGSADTSAGEEPLDADEPAIDEAAHAEPDAQTVPEPTEPEAPAPGKLAKRPEPIEIQPRPARKRRAGLRRRRIDARKLAGIDPATALRAMVSAIDDIWTAGVTLDLVIALTDGGSLKVTGGHNQPLSVLAVKPGSPARTTVTATTAQLIPLFGRLELTDEQSPPMIYGPRRDADLLVGWIDRAQRLDAQPL